MAFLLYKITHFVPEKLLLLKKSGLRSGLKKRGSIVQKSGARWCAAKVKSDFPTHSSKTQEKRKNLRTTPI